MAGPSVSTRFVSFLREQRLRLAATPRQYAIYLAVYLTVGAINDWIGIRFRIAEFAHWWQVATCYGGYLVPVSLWVRRESPLRQYAVGVLALIPLELAGYALGTSIAHDGNVFDAVVGPRNFTLAMCVLFGVIPPAGNAIVRGIDRALERGRSAIFVRMERDPSV